MGKEGFLLESSLSFRRFFYIGCNKWLVESSHFTTYLDTMSTILEINELHKEYGA